MMTYDVAIACAICGEQFYYRIFPGQEEPSDTSGLICNECDREHR